MLAVVVVVECMYISAFVQTTGFMQHVDKKYFIVLDETSKAKQNLKGCKFIHLNFTFGVSKLFLS